jgi:hypothetical protein
MLPPADEGSLYLRYQNTVSWNGTALDTVGQVRETICKQTVVAYRYNAGMHLKAWGKPRKPFPLLPYFLFIIQLCSTLSSSVRSFHWEMIERDDATIIVGNQLQTPSLLICSARWMCDSVLVWADCNSRLCLLITHLLVWYYKLIFVDYVSTSCGQNL